MSEATLILAVASLADALSAHIRGDTGRALRKLEQVDKTLQRAAVDADRAQSVTVEVHGAITSEQTRRNAVDVRALAASVCETIHLNRRPRG